MWSKITSDLDLISDEMFDGVLGPGEPDDETQDHHRQEADQTED